MYSLRLLLKVILGTIEIRFDGREIISKGLLRISDWGLRSRGDRGVLKSKVPNT